MSSSSHWRAGQIGAGEQPTAPEKCMQLGNISLDAPLLQANQQLQSCICIGMACSSVASKWQEAWQLQGCSCTCLACPTAPVWQAWQMQGCICIEVTGSGTAARCICIGLAGSLTAADRAKDFLQKLKMEKRVPKLPLACKPAYVFRAPGQVLGKGPAGSTAGDGESSPSRASDR